MCALRQNAAFAFLTVNPLCVWVGLFLPEGACGRGHRRAKCPDVLFMLLHCGNAYFEGGDVGQKGARGERGQLPLSVLLRRQQCHKLDLDYCTGKTKHTPRESRAAAGGKMEGAAGQKRRDGVGLVHSLGYNAAQLGI